MRVVRRNGETASMVGLGEDLQLRIEIDVESAFGLFARKLEARTDNGELMNLVDDSGCPVNELIFPALKLEPGTRALYADFKAFRFPSTPIVNFVATVQFCQDICEPMDCSGGLESYGRKRRSSGSQSEFQTFDIYTRTSASEEKSRHRRSDNHRQGRVLPEHVDLGLRLTVGEDVLKKPFLQSSHGSGHFPEMSAQTEPSPNEYFPSLSGGIPAGESSDSDDIVCSPHSAVVASVVIVVVMNVVMLAAFVIFYRYKKRSWLKRQGVAATRPLSSVSRVHPASSAPPPLPSRPATAQGSIPPVYNSSTTGDVIYKDAYNNPLARQRFNPGLNAASMTSLPMS